MKNIIIILAGLIVFSATGSSVATEVYLRNEAYNLAGYYYDIYYSINYNLENKLAGQKTALVGDLDKINVIRISRAGTLSTFSPWSYIPEEKIAELKEYAKSP